MVAASYQSYKFLSYALSYDISVLVAFLIQLSLSDHELSEERIERASNIITNIASQEQENIQHLINSLSVDAPLTATEYITVDDKDANDEMVTDDEIISLFLPAEEEDDDDGESSSMPTVLTKDAVVAFETALNFLQQGDIEINYNELKAFCALKRKVELHSVANKKQARIDIFFTG